MEKNIFTNEQYDYFVENSEKIVKIENISKNLSNYLDSGDISFHSSEAGESVVEVINYLSKNYEEISNNLKPFEERNNIYESKKAEIIKSHGFDSNDMYDEDTIKDIVQLQNSMKSEANNLSTDLKNNIVNDKENELNKMMINENTDNYSKLAARFK